ncbi:hypothetical protein [Leptospira noguchii]|nr:hypothetical protein [Leptospira noguchii]
MDSIKCNKNFDKGTEVDLILCEKKEQNLFYRIFSSVEVVSKRI